MNSGDNQVGKRMLLVLMLVFVSGLLLRIAYLRLAGYDFYLVRDAKQYVDYANNLAEYGVFSMDRQGSPPLPDSFRSPGYPVFIAAILKVIGEEHYLRYLVYIQGILSALLIPLTFFTGLFFMPAVYALAASILTAFSPHLVTTSRCILTETLLSFVLLAAICCLQYAVKKPVFRLSVLAALLFGSAILINEAFLPVPYILIIVAWVFRNKKQNTDSSGNALRSMIIVALIVTLFPAAWNVRNHCNVSAAAPQGSSRAISTMSHGAYPNFIYKNPLYQRFPYREDPEQPEFGSSWSSFRRILWSRFKEEPVRFAAWYLLGKPYYLWSWNILQGVGDIYIYPVKNSLFQISATAGSIRLIMKFLHPIVLVLALLSIPAVFSHSRIDSGKPVKLFIPLFPFAVCIYLTFLYMVFAPWPRYGVPVRPELYLCAVWTLFVCLRERHNSKAEKAMDGRKTTPY